MAFFQKKPHKLSFGQIVNECTPAPTSPTTTTATATSAIPAFDIKTKLFKSSTAVSEFERGEHDVISFETELDQKINQVLEHTDPLDSSEFNPVEYVNLLFPDEQAMEKADKILYRLRGHIQSLDKEMKDLVHLQTDASQQTKDEIEQIKTSIASLISHVKAIKVKAANSELMVLDITQDIKSLDLAKKNVSASITLLKRLQILGRWIYLNR